MFLKGLSINFTLQFQEIVVCLSDPQPFWKEDPTEKWKKNWVTLCELSLVETLVAGFISCKYVQSEDGKKMNEK